jgi:tetratricopeptide (TPR) repeat protein
LAHDRGWDDDARVVAEEGLAVVRDSEELARSWPAAVLLFFAGQDLSLVQHKPGPARPLIEEGLAILGELGDLRWAEMGLFNLAQIALAEGDVATARMIHEGAIRYGRETDSAISLIIFLRSLGELEERQGNYALARSLYQESLDRRRTLKVLRLGNPHGTIAQLLNELARVSRLQGDYQAARLFAEQALAAARELGIEEEIAASLASLERLHVTKQPDELGLNRPDSR